MMIVRKTHKKKVQTHDLVPLPKTLPFYGAVYQLIINTNRIDRYKR